MRLLEEPKDSGVPEIVMEGPPNDKIIPSQNTTLPN